MAENYYGPQDGKTGIESENQRKKNWGV